MLVLSRKRDERILIGDEIEINVIAIHGNRVRLGIICPEHVRILRSELAQALDVSSSDNSLEVVTS